MEGLSASFEVPFADALAAKAGATTIIRSVYLGSTEKLNKIIEYAGSSRIAFVQYNPEEEAWRKIIREHQHLAAIKQPHVHLSLPVLAPLYPKPPRQETYHEKEIADILPKLLNMEGWAMYSCWLHEKFEMAIEQFKFDAIDEYTLEARLEDFRHEVFSDLLSKNLSAIHQLDLPDVKRTLEEEKQLIRLQQELRRMIEDQYTVLKDIVASIEEIEKVHPELTKIEESSIILRNLLENQLLPFDRATLRWGLQEMYLQLLDDALDVLPILNCSKDHGRTFFAMALRLSIVQLKGSHSVRELIQMIENWDKNGETPLVKKFKKNVLENLRGIHQVRPNHNHETMESDLVPNPEYWNYLPHDKHLVIYDPITGIPSDLTEAGRKLLYS